MSGKTITWNTIASTTIPELVVGKVDREILGRQRGIHIPMDGREGTYHFEQRPGRRLVTAHCYLESGVIADRGLAVEEVADWLDVVSEAKLAISDNPGRYYLAVLGTVPTPDEWRHKASFQIEWLAQPYSFDDNVTMETWTSGADEDHIWSPLLTVNVFPVIEITPTNGTLLGFTLSDTGGNELSWTGVLQSGETININSIVPAVLTGANDDTELVGFYNAEDRSMANVSGQFPELLPTTNNNIHFIRTAGTATSFTINLSYRAKYRR